MAAPAPLRTAAPLATCLARPSSIPSSLMRPTKARAVAALVTKRRSPLLSTTAAAHVSVQTLLCTSSFSGLSALPSARSSAPPSACCWRTQLRDFHATSVGASGVHMRNRQIPQLPLARDETGKVHRDRSEDVFYHDTGNSYTHQVFLKAAEKGGISDPCSRWLNTGGLRFYDLLEKPRNYLMGDCPYPMNPWYKAIPPISNDTRNTVFLLHHSDTKKWTPYRLAEEFGLSVPRIAAIIKSKTTETEMRQKGEIIETVFAATMDKILGAKHIERRAAQYLESPFEVDSIQKSPTPKLVAVPESYDVDQKRAATLLAVESIAETKDRLREQVEAKAPEFTRLSDVISGKLHVVPHDELVKVAPVIAPPNPMLANLRHAFRITDLSNKLGGGEYGRRTLVRERDGSLREATPIERRAAIKKRFEGPDIYVGPWGKKVYNGRKFIIDRVNGVHLKISPNKWY